MNNVVYAVTGAYKYDGAPDSDGFITEKTLKIFVPDLNGRGNKILFRGGEYQFGAETAVIPPAVPHKIENLGGTPAEGITVAIEQPLTPLKAVDILGWCDNDCIRQAAEQSVYFYNDDCTGREAVLAALGNLIVSYISAFYPDRQSPVTKALREDIEKNLADSAYSAETAIRKLPLNYDYVRKMFKKEVGVSPHDYLTYGARADDNFIGRDQPIFRLYRHADCRGVRIFRASLLLPRVQKALRRCPLLLHSAKKVKNQSKPSALKVRTACPFLRQRI